MKKRLHPAPRFDTKLFDCQYNAALKAVDMFFNDIQRSKFWLICINPLLGNVSPVSMLKVGRFDKLMNFIYTSLDENMAPR